jgi:replicative DNA helicase
MLEGKDYHDLVTKEDIPNINRIIKGLYSSPLKDAEFIRDRIYQFSTYVEMKNLNDTFDLTDFNHYAEYASKVDAILQNSKPKEEDEPIFLIRDVASRQLRRLADPDVVPCPYRQLNDLTNAGGFPKASIIVLLDKPKAKKTFFLVNVARGYLRMKKSVLYVDLENGKHQIMDRVVQGSINRSKAELYTGEYDKQEAQHVRKLSRFGVEMVIDRGLAYVTDCNYIKNLILKLRSQGIDIRVLVVDYAMKLASISRKTDDFERISDAYVDMQNLAEELQLDCVWTANHIKREGAKRRTTKYEENDIAGCIDIVRHAQCIMGLNATEQEENDNIQRLELIVQRDGQPHGRALFKIDVEKQRAIEFTKEQRKAYEEAYGNKLNENITKSQKEEHHGDI